MLMYVTRMRGAEVLFTLWANFPVLWPKMSVFALFYAARFATAAHWPWAFYTWFVSTVHVNSTSRCLVFLLVIIKIFITISFGTTFFLHFLHNMDPYTLHTVQNLTQLLSFFLFHHWYYIYESQDQTVLNELRRGGTMSLTKFSDQIWIPRPQSYFSKSISHSVWLQCFHLYLVENTFK